ncbi:MAG: hypothetical protein ACI87N_003031, partial [Flavobacteriales bacterium]
LRITSNENNKMLKALKELKATLDKIS